MSKSRRHVSLFDKQRSSWKSKAERDREVALDETQAQGRPFPPLQLARRKEAAVRAHMHPQRSGLETE